MDDARLMTYTIGNKKIKYVYSYWIMNMGEHSHGMELIGEEVYHKNYKQ